MQPASSIAEHATSSCGGWQAAMQFTPPWTLHISFPSNTAPPHAETMSARAAPAANVTIAPHATARSEDHRDMGNPPKTGIVPDETACVDSCFNGDARLPPFFQLYCQTGPKRRLPKSMSGPHPGMPVFPNTSAGSDRTS
jgi:hypothetical protein